MLHAEVGSAPRLRNNIIAEISNIETSLTELEKLVDTLGNILIPISSNPTTAIANDLLKTAEIGSQGMVVSKLMGIEETILNLRRVIASVTDKLDL